MSGRVTAVGFLDALRGSRPVFDTLEEVGRGDLLSFSYDPARGEVACRLPPRLASGLAPATNAERAIDYSRESFGVLGLAQLWAQGRLVADGPRVFRPTARQCEALEQVEVGISPDDYRQPYPLMAVELPADYATARAVPVPQGDGSLAFRADAVLVGHLPDAKSVVVVLLGFGNRMLTSVLTPSGRPGATFEDALARTHSWTDATAEGGPRTYDPAPVEGDQARLSRLALNAMLTLSHFGHRAEVANPAHAARVAKRSRLARTREEKDSAAREVRLLPQVVSFSQEVTLYDDRRPPAEPGPATGRAVSPHWRRGHWASQPHGPAHSLRKRIFRRPVLVHAEAVTGTPAQSAVTYRVPERTQDDTT